MKNSSDIELVTELSFRDPTLTLILELFVSFLDSSKSNSQHVFLESCQNFLDYDQRQLFANLPYICNFLPQFSIGNSQFIHLLCRYIYPSQLFELSRSLTLFHLSLFRKNVHTSKSTQSLDRTDWRWVDLLPLLRDSLAWSAYEQQCFWQLLVAESSAMLASDDELFFPLLEFLERHVEAEHVAALQGCQSLLAAFPPLAHRLTRVLTLPEQFSPSFIAPLLARWLVASCDGSLLVTQLQSALDGLLPLGPDGSRIDLVLWHLMVFRMANSAHIHVFFSAGVKTRIVQAMEKFELTTGSNKEFYDYCKSM